MKIDRVSLYYLAMPKVLDEGDGSQDALVVRIDAGPYTGWGECEASPLVSIAGYVCPMSHSACKPVGYSVEGQTVDSVDDIRRIGRLVQENSFDLLQARHILSGIDCALWDLLGKIRSEPVWRLLGFSRSYPKRPYASVLFGRTPEETGRKAAEIRAKGFSAVKFGWGPFGRTSASADALQVQAARSGFGDGTLMVDAGTVWQANPQAAQERLACLVEAKVHWLEEPFATDNLGAYGALASKRPGVALAAGEGSHTEAGATNLIDYGAISFVQIDAGRVGGITAAAAVAEHARRKNVCFVNHTFTSNLALAASVQPLLGTQDNELIEFPIELKPLARELTREVIAPDPDGLIRFSDAPGLGVTPNPDTMRTYLQEVEIRVGGRTLYSTPGV